jgi:hypothetical protein
MSYFKTPGVYIKEQDAFGSSVVAVPTAVPAFIGYTQTADIDGNSQLMKAVKIRTFPEFREIFGGGPATQFDIALGNDGTMDLTPVSDKYFMYSAINGFYANGGGQMYVVSIGTYGDAVDSEKMLQAIELLTRETEPTLLVCPDAVLLEKDDCYTIYKTMLQHCGIKMKSRFAILDVYNGFNEKSMDQDVQDFREGIGANALAFGAGYYPWVHTTLTPASEVDYRRIADSDKLIKILMDNVKDAMFGGGGGDNPKLAEAQKLIASIKDDLSNLDDVGKKLAAIDKGFSKPKDKDAKKVKATLSAKAVELLGGANAIDPNSPEGRKLTQIEAAINRIKDPNDDVKAVHSVVASLAPIYKTILKNVRESLNLVPPSGIMAGVYSLVDNTEGVHKAPANVSLNSVIKPSVNINSDDQEDLNSPLSGKAINAIRSFVGKGVLVWGARTLDANSQDWRYIPVRRTMIMIQQSIKNAVEAYVFEPNVSRTWLKLKTSIENFLGDVWKNGSLAGASPTQAYEVNVGLGSTMTPNDILEGIMRISVKCAITRPAEFIEITFEQKMQES